tara:strand:+ start:22160 stop:22885 length:726 start_codon:yes stop_codon:yes gene_type:complete
MEQLNQQQNGRKIAKDKEVLQNIFKFNETLEKLVESSHMNEESYRQLAEQTQGQYNAITELLEHQKYLEKKIALLRENYMKTIVESNWVQQYNPQTLKKAQAKKRMRKWEAHEWDINQYKCECGDFICKSKDGVKKHLRTDKHISGVQRIKWEKNGKLKKVAPLEQCLVLNSHLHYIHVSPKKQKKYIDKVPKSEDYDVKHPRMIKNSHDALKMLLRRRYINNLGYEWLTVTDTDSSGSDD